MAFTFKPGPPPDAWQFWQNKVPMSRKEFNRLADDDRVKAFIVGGMAKGDMLTAMHESIGTALADGQGLKTWKKDIRGLFDQKGWTQMQNWRLDNIFRTNVQTAYSVGRYGGMQAVAKARPWWRYSAINDSRTRMTHAALHGRVVRHDDPFWDKFYPPNGFRCRCTVTSLSDRDLARKGYTPETIEPGQLLEIPDGPQKGRAVPVMPDNNFQNNPGKSYWQADTTKYRADVRQLVLADLAASIPAGLLPDSDDYARLKRHLTQADLEDMQTLVWARGQQVGKDFGDWAEGVVSSMQEKGELYPVGAVPARVLDALKTQPRLALVTMDDKQLVHMVRDAKKNRGSALSITEIQQIPEQLRTGRWFRDKEKKNLLVTWVRSGDDWLKLAINLDYKIGNRKALVANHVMTSGLVKKADIVMDKRYEEI